MSHVFSSALSAALGSTAGAEKQPQYPQSGRDGDINNRLISQFHAVCELTSKIDTASSDPTPSLRLIVETAADTLSVERVSIWMLNSTRASLDCFDQFHRLDRSHIIARSLPASAFPSIEATAIPHQRIFAVDSIGADDPAESTGSDTGAGPRHRVARIDVPIRLRGETVGFIAFEDSTSLRKWEIDELGFAVVIADIASRTVESSEARRGEEELVYRLKFEELLTSLARLFINLSADSVDGGINFALSEIGRFAGVDRCYALYSPDDLLTVSHAHEWCAPGITSFKDQLHQITPSLIPWVFKQLAEFDSIKIDRIEDLPDGEFAARDYFESKGVRSFIMVPLISSGHRAGCLGLETIHGSRTWEEGDISFLRIVGEMFVNALDRKRSEEQINDQQVFFRKVIDLNPNFIFAKDREGRFTLVNQAVADAYGTTVDGIVGLTDADFNSDKEQVEWFRRADLEVLNSKTPKFIPEERITDASGKLRWLQTVKIPIINTDGHSTHLLGVATDITERKRYEEEQRRLESQIQHTQKLESLGVLAGGIAHDFNNLLMGVLGNAGLALIETPPDGPARTRLEQIKVAAKRASELTNQLLAYSGKGKFIVGPIDLNNVVGEMTALLETIISKKASFRLNLSPEVKPIEADATQLRQVVMNLITNASDALGENSGIISISTGIRFIQRTEMIDYLLKDNITDGEYSFLEITDTGCGMNSDALLRIFDPFYTTKFTGHGLGLAAVIGIVRSHRGTLAVESTPGNGTTFRVYFPVIKAMPHPTISQTKPAVDTFGRGGLFLVVDDEETTRVVAAEMLRHFGYEVIVACDGREGVDKFKLNAERLSGVILDMTMPILDGEEALKEMAQINSSVPVILSSGYCEQDVTDRVEKRSVAGFIQKPYGPSALLRVIQQARTER